MSQHKQVYLKGSASMVDMISDMLFYFKFYKSKLPHQSLGQRTLGIVYRTPWGKLNVQRKLNGFLCFG
jgi:hypothetical protein